MYAIILSGGKQHRVMEGETLKLESLPVKEGQNIDFDKILMISNGDNIQIGAPNITGATVSATVISHGRGKKIRVFKFKRRKKYRRTIGHRQNFTEVKITSIQAA